LIFEYSSRDNIVKIESFGEIISRDRYLLILKMLHFHDNRINNPLKIRTVLDELKISCKTAFYPYENLCIDENLLLFKQFTHI